MSSLQKFIPANSQVESLDHTKPLLVQDQKVGLGLDQHAIPNGTDTEGRQSVAILRSLDHNSGSSSGLNALQSSYYAQGNQVNPIGPQYENSLFSSSLPELFSGKRKPLAVPFSMWSHLILFSLSGVTKLH